MSDPTLKVRVDGLTEDVAGVRSEMRDMRITISAELSALSTKLDDRSKPQTQTLLGLCGLLLTFFTVVGGMSYMIIKSTTDGLATNQHRLDSAIERIIDNAVFIKGYAQQRDADGKVITGIIERADRAAATASNTREGVAHNAAEISRMQARSVGLEKQIDGSSDNVKKLYNHAELNATGIARQGALIEDANRRIDAVSARLAEFIRDYTMRTK